jgi:hypothetical protein
MAQAGREREVARGRDARKLSESGRLPEVAGGATAPSAESAE